ncbi:hypothetical protein CK203_107973 [Vitis vinifera]|uniref:Uncharacterized protein n=1 Tax=Vitis vinifera TaxID=29760 RepID=A0A438BR01_VITVI|nr:hypothetical protein CK203_107973 [Vitis vinifera]
MQEKENSPSQPYQNSKGIHEVEAQKGESSMVKEVKTVITLSGKEVDLPTCKLEHKEESETEKEKGEEIKGKKKGKSIDEDDYDFDIDEDPRRIVIKEEMMKKHMPPLFFQAFCEALFWHTSTISHHSSPRFAAAKWLRNLHALKSSISQPRLHFAGYFEAVKPLFGTRVPFGSPVHSFRSCKMAAKPPHLKILQRAHHELTCHSRTPILETVGHISITSRSPNYEYHMSFQILGSQESIASNGARFGVEAKKLWLFEDDCANHERKCRTSISLILDTFLKHFLELKLCIPYVVSKLGKSGVQRFKRYMIWR